MNNRAMVFMLRSVHIYTENENSKETARKLLLAYSTAGNACEEIQRAKSGVYGGFMRAICSGDFFEAYGLADETNQDALAMGMERFFSQTQTNLYDDGIEPSDYLPETSEVKQ